MLCGMADIEQGWLESCTRIDEELFVEIRPLDVGKFLDEIVDRLGSRDIVKRVNVECSYQSFGEFAICARNNRVESAAPKNVGQPAGLFNPIIPCANRE